MEEYANHLQSQHPELAPEELLELAHEIFMERGRTATTPLTKFDLYFERELELDADWAPGDVIETDETKYRKRKIVDGKVVDSARHQ